MQSHRQLTMRVHPHTGAVFLAWVLMSVEELPLAFPVRRADRSKPFSRNVILAALLDSRLTASLNICAPAAGEKPVPPPGSSGNPQRFLLVFGSPHFCRACELTRSSLSFRMC